MFAMYFEIFQLKRLQEGAKTDDSFVKSKVNLTLLPPEHPQLLRRVGGDGLLVSWTPPEDDEVTGYLVMDSHSPDQSPYFPLFRSMSTLS